MAKELTGVVSLDLTKAPEMPANTATIAQFAAALQVTDELSYTQATELIQFGNQVIAKVEGFYEKDKSLAHQLHASICEKIRTFTAPWRSIRPTLEPRMKAFRAAQERQRREAEAAILRQQQEAERRAQEEAARIQREAEERARELKQQGDMRAAKEAMQAAQAKAEEIVQTAAAIAEVGIVVADTKPQGGPGEAMIWGGVVDDVLEVCRAVGSKKVSLMFELPKRGGGSEMVPLVEVSQKVIDYLAKRQGRADIGVPGCHGQRELSLRFSAKGAALQTGAVEDQEGW